MAQAVLQDAHPRHHDCVDGTGQDQAARDVNQQPQDLARGPLSRAPARARGAPVQRHGPDAVPGLYLVRGDGDAPQLEVGIGRTQPGQHRLEAGVVSQVAAPQIAVEADAANRSGHEVLFSWRLVEESRPRTEFTFLATRAARDDSPTSRTARSGLERNFSRCIGLAWPRIHSTRTFRHRQRSRRLIGARLIAEKKPRMYSPSSRMTGCRHRLARAGSSRLHRTRMLRLPTRVVRFG